MHVRKPLFLLIDWIVETSSVRRRRLENHFLERERETTYEIEENAVFTDTYFNILNFEDNIEALSSTV